MQMTRRTREQVAQDRALEDRIVAVLSRRDEVGMHAVGRALVCLLARQTQDERLSLETRHSNQRGFTQGDAVKGQKHAEYYSAYGRLTEFQVNYWTRKRIRNAEGRIVSFGEPARHIIKYRAQLMEEAQLKQQRATA